MSCDRCATGMHEDCRELAGRCPILGCRPRFHLSIRAAVEHPCGATVWHLGAWLTTLIGDWTVLFWAVPRVTKIFEKRKQLLPVPTRGLVDLQHFAHSGLGIVTLTLIVALSISLFVKSRERPATRRAFVALTALGVLLIPFALMAVFLPLVNMARVWDIVNCW